MRPLWLLPGNRWRLTPSRFRTLNAACWLAKNERLPAARARGRYEEDADLAKAAGFRGFRLSLAWSRIYPEGEGQEPNQEGIRHYHDVLDAIILRELEPLVTLYHWDLPQASAPGTCPAVASKAEAVGSRAARSPRGDEEPCRR